MHRSETSLIHTVVELADSLVEGFDVIDLFTTLSNRCAEAFECEAAGVLLLSTSGELEYLASSNESMEMMEMFQIQSHEGPCIECFETGKPVINRSLSASVEMWPNFAPKAVSLGFNSVHCFPLRLRGRIMGALNLFRTTDGVLAPDEAVLAQGLADIATIAILQQRTIEDANILNVQLNYALNSRIIIEQAKGMISQSLGCDMLTAFDLLRNHSRNHNRQLTDLARAIVEGEIGPGTLDPPKSPQTSANSSPKAVS